MENSVEICGAALPCTLAQTGAQFLGTLRAGKEAFQQSTQVEAGTSDEDWQVLACLDLGQDLAGLAGIFPRSHLLGWIDAVKQMMRNLGAFGRARLGGSNIQPGIHGDRIAVDDLSRQFFGEGDGERGLTACGGAQDDQQERFAGRGSGMLRP